MAADIYNMTNSALKKLRITTAWKVMRKKYGFSPEYDIWAVENVIETVSQGNTADHKAPLNRLTY